MTTLSALQPASPAGNTAGPVARAVDVVKTYGHGEAAVRALDGASVAIPRGAFTAVMGAVRFRQVDPGPRPRRPGPRRLRAGPAR